MTVWRGIALSGLGLALLPLPLPAQQAGGIVGGVTDESGAALPGVTVLSDVDSYYVSRLPGEPAGGVADVHSPPASPRSARVSLLFSF